MSRAATITEALDGHRATQATAKLEPRPSVLREVAADALRHLTSQKAAALDLQLSEGRLSHKLKDGTLTLKQLEAFGEDYAAEFGRLLAERASPSRDPRAKARQKLRDIRQQCDEVDQLLERIA